MSEDLESLSSKELHDRAMSLAKERRDLRFLWEMLRSIPAAEAAVGNVDRADFDLLHAFGLVEEFTHADEGELADALRPVYIDYLRRNESDAG